MPLLLWLLLIVAGLARVAGQGLAVKLKLRCNILLTVCASVRAAGGNPATKIKRRNPQVFCVPQQFGPLPSALTLCAEPGRQAGRLQAGSSQL